MRWQYSGKSDVGRVRSGNEDAFYGNEEQGVFLVADGMGGHAAGEIASQMVAEQVGPGVARAVEQGLRGEDLTKRIGQLVAAANEAILDRADNEPDKRGMGTTLSLLALLPEGDCLLSQVGDSRVYRFRNGTLEQVTRDHTLVQQQVDRGALTAEQARDHPLSHILTRALGTEEDVEADIYHYDLDSGDRFLLCSDGLSGMLSDAEISEILSTAGDDLDQITAALIEAANDAGGQDNITAVVVEVTD